MGPSNIYRIAYYNGEQVYKLEVQYTVPVDTVKCKYLALKRERLATEECIGHICGQNRTQHDHLPVKAEEVLGAQESHQQQTNSANDETLRRRSAKGKSSDYTIQSQQ